MAVELLIRYKDPNRETKLISIAGQKPYRLYWVPLSEELNQKWIRYISNVGMHILTHLDILPELIGELHQLRDQMLVSPSDALQAWGPEREVKGIDLLLEQLDYIQQNMEDIADAHVG